MEDRRRAGEQSGLRHVGVDNLRTEGRDDAKQGDEGARVRPRRDGPSERRNLPRAARHARVVHQIAHVAFGVADAAVEQQRVESLRGQTARESNRLDRWSADVQARDDAQHADWTVLTLRHCQRLLYRNVTS